LFFYLSIGFNFSGAKLEINVKHTIKSVNFAIFLISKHLSFDLNFFRVPEMNIDKRGGKRPRRPRITRSDSSKNDKGHGMDNSIGRTNFKDEKRHDHSALNDDFSSGKRQMSRSLSRQGTNLQGENRFPNPFSRKGKSTFSSQIKHRDIVQKKKVYSGSDKGKAGSYGGKSFPDSGEIRLNRFIAHSGICSRRQADDYIKAGLVSINGKVVTEMGMKVKPEDVVKYNGETIRSERKVYILLNKPKNYVTTLEDEENRKTVMELIRDACPERVYPVGRLDRNTTGVMLLTNDGELTGKLTHPRYNKKKIYHVFLDKNLKKEDLKSVAEGITLEDGPIAPDAITYIDPAKKSEVGIEIHSGRNRIVRRIFEYFGYNVIRLDRVYFAGLTKKNLARGKWRFLTEKEIYALKMNSYE